MADPATPSAPVQLVWSRRLSEADGRDFDDFVAGAEAGHFAQTRAWSPLARAGRPFGSSYVLARDGAGQVVGAAHVLRARIAGVPLPYAVIERGPVVVDPALFAPVLRALARAAWRRGVVRLSVMPYWEVTAGAVVRAALDMLGWRSVQTAAGAHAATLRLELAGRAGAGRAGAGQTTEPLAPDAPAAPLASLFLGAAHKKLRQEIRYAERAGAQARRGSAEELPRFVALHRGLMAEQGLHPKTDAWFRALGALGLGPAGPVGLFFTEHEGETVAAALTIRHGRLVTLYLAATAPAPRKFSKMVPCLVAAIEWARALHCDFDLGGVPMAGDTDPKRLSIAQFKRDFATTRLELIGQHARWLP